MLDMLLINYMFSGLMVLIANELFWWCRLRYDASRVIRRGEHTVVSVVEFVSDDSKSQLSDD